MVFIYIFLGIVIIALLCKIPGRKESGSPEKTLSKNEAKRIAKYPYGEKNNIFLTWHSRNPKGSESDYRKWLFRADSDFLDYLEINPYEDENDYEMWLDSDIYDDE